MTPQLAALLGGLGPRAEAPVFAVPVVTLKMHFARALKAAGIENVRLPLTSGSTVLPSGHGTAREDRQ